MYDFCFTLPYGALMVFGGIVGFLMSGSIPSLTAGTASGLLLIALGYTSLNQYKRGRLCKPATVASLVVAMALTAVMYMRYMKTQKVFPALVFMVLSGFMSVYYVWNLLLGPPPKTAKAKA